MERQVFTSKEARKLAGITYRQLDYWCSTGLLRPEEREGKGKGDFRLFTFRDIVGLRLIKRMKDSGVSLQSLRKVQEVVRGFTGGDAVDVFKNEFLIVQGEEVYVVKDRDVIATLRQPGARSFPGMVLDMTCIIKELQEEVKKLKRSA